MKQDFSAEWVLLEASGYNQSRKVASTLPRCPEAMWKGPVGGTWSHQRDTPCGPHSGHLEATARELENGALALTRSETSAGRVVLT